MTKRYGTICGAARISDSWAGLNPGHRNGRVVVLADDTIELAAAPATDTISAAVLAWETLLDPYGSDFSFDDLGTGNTLSLGDQTYPNALCNAQDVATAAGTAKACKSVGIEKYFQPLWQMLGYADIDAARAVGPKCELLFTINGAAATGTLSWRFKGSPQ